MHYLRGLACITLAFSQEFWIARLHFYLQSLPAIEHSSEPPGALCSFKRVLQSKLNCEAFDNLPMGGRLHLPLVALFAMKGALIYRFFFRNRTDSRIGCALVDFFNMVIKIRY